MLDSQFTQIALDQRAQPVAGRDKVVTVAAHRLDRGDCGRDLFLSIRATGKRGDQSWPITRAEIVEVTGVDVHARSVDLVFLVEVIVYFRLHVRNDRAETETEADIRLEVAEKILAALAGLQAVNDVGERVVQAVRQAKLPSGIIHRFAIVHAAAAASGASGVPTPRVLELGP